MPEIKSAHEQKSDECCEIEVLDLDDCVIDDRRIALYRDLGCRRRVPNPTLRVDRQHIVGSTQASRSARVYRFERDASSYRTRTKTGIL
jgi:hypothetical protein